MLAQNRKEENSQFQQAADVALWFGESFGLVPMQLMVWTSKSNEAISLTLSGSITPLSLPDTLPAREIDEVCAMQTIYLLDTFGVSDEFYHELTQVCNFSQLKDECLCLHDAL